ncbi:MAG: hypothetical protein SH850_05895 [Planctomycetaceae bacterium]|nr:hypothetical protein [Planctomycetaceae bacterium]
MTPAFALVWRRDCSPGIRWYIRRLVPDGFYGEVRHHPPAPSTGGRAMGVSHHFGAVDGERVAAILAEFAEAVPTEPGPCFALLGRYTESLGQSEIVFKYEPGAEADCPQARRFLELHAIVESYLAAAYSQIAEPGAAPDRGGE